MRILSIGTELIPFPGYTHALRSKDVRSPSCPGATLIKHFLQSISICRSWQGKHKLFNFIMLPNLITVLNCTIYMTSLDLCDVCVFAHVATCAYTLTHTHTNTHTDTHTHACYSHLPFGIGSLISARLQCVSIGPEAAGCQVNLKSYKEEDGHCLSCGRYQLFFLNPCWLA